ncbi:MAG TPA: J domain-containing protein [Campylobacterales bacterium]|nr:J domain-containing protein [Campylobacterales bacterium]
MSKVVNSIQKALDILGLPPLVTLKDIKDRYYYLAKKHHPDSGGSKKKMQELNRAYKILKEYIENYKFSFSEEEILKQFPNQAHTDRFKF